jgi:hypothetical protein
MTEGDEAVDQSDEIPADRVFYTLRLYLNESNEVAGEGAYDGPALKALGVDRLKAIECVATARAINERAQQAIHQVGLNVDLLGGLLNLGDEGTDNEKDDQHGRKETKG